MATGIGDGLRTSKCRCLTGLEEEQESSCGLPQIRSANHLRKEQFLKLDRRKRVTALLSASVLCWVALAASIPTQALASCAVWPGTNPITITPHPAINPVEVPGTDQGMVGFCVSVEGSPDPQVDGEPHVDTPPGCGIPCFVVSWDGVTTSPFTITITVYRSGNPQSTELTVPGGSTPICINAGTPCP